MKRFRINAGDACQAVLVAVGDVFIDLQQGNEIITIDIEELHDFCEKLQTEAFDG